MIRTTLLTAAALLAVSEPITPPVASADTVKGALCELEYLAPAGLPEGAVFNLEPPADFTCDFTQMRGNVYVDSNRWKFVFLDAENGTTYTRQNTEDFKRFTRPNQYRLTVFESGEKPNEPGGF